MSGAVLAGLRGRCPRCGRGALFDGFLELREACDVCGLPIRRLAPGDGPAVFVILALGLIVVGLAFWVEMRHRPPMWVHAALWIPSILGLSLGMLRPVKGLMAALAWRHRAADDEGNRA